MTVSLATRASAGDAAALNALLTELQPLVVQTTWLSALGPGLLRMQRRRRFWTSARESAGCVTRPPCDRGRYGWRFAGRSGLRVGNVYCGLGTLRASKECRNPRVAEGVKVR